MEHNTLRSLTGVAGCGSSALFRPFEEGPVSDFVDPATDPFEPLPLDEARTLAPVAPSKIVCVGRNYREHAAELGNEVPAEPLLFLKPPSALLSPGAGIRIPELSKRVDFEGEIAIVIGERCSRIGTDEDPRDYIRGYTIANDVTARDLQKKDGQWSRAKGFDTFCPVGPLVTDEVDPAAGIGITTRPQWGTAPGGQHARLYLSHRPSAALYHRCHDPLSRGLGAYRHPGRSGSHAAWRSGGDYRGRDWNIDESRRRMRP